MKPWEWTKINITQTGCVAVANSKFQDSSRNFPDFFQDLPPKHVGNLEVRFNIDFYELGPLMFVFILFFLPKII